MRATSLELEKILGLTVTSLHLPVSVLQSIGSAMLCYGIALLFQAFSFKAAMMGVLISIGLTQLSWQVVVWFQTMSAAHWLKIFYWVEMLKMLMALGLFYLAFSKTSHAFSVLIGFAIAQKMLLLCSLWAKEPA